MPPKTNPVIIVDGEDISTMTRSVLEEFALVKKVELDHIREERHFSQVDRDKVATFWRIGQNQLEEVKAEIRIKERSIDEYREKAEALRETQLQEIKFLIYEKESIIAALKAEDQVSREAAFQEHIQQEEESFKEKRNIKTDIAAINSAIKEELRRLITVQAEEFLKLNASFKQQINELEIELEEIRIKTLAQLTIKHRTELNEIEERKNKQLADLISNNEKSFTELNNYYNDITVNNLELIKNIKEEIEKMQEQQEAANLVAAKAQAVTKNLRQPLEKAILENKELSRQMGNYDRDKTAFATKMKRIKEVAKKFEDMNFQCESLQKRFDLLEAERNDLRANFNEYLESLKMKAAGVTSTMENKIETMEKNKFAPTLLLSILRMRDIQVDDLLYETARLCKAHDDLLVTYEAELAKFGMPLQELGFEPLKTTQIEGLDKPIIGRGPSGLVAKNIIS